MGHSTVRLTSLVSMGPFGAGIESINPFAAAAHAVTDGIPGIIRKYALTQGMN